MSKGSNIQYYNVTCSVASKKLGVSAGGKKKAVIRDSFGCRGEYVEARWSQ
jgi:hypothetical protein